MIGNGTPNSHSKMPLPTVSSLSAQSDPWSRNALNKAEFQPRESESSGACFAYGRHVFPYRSQRHRRAWSPCEIEQRSVWP